MGKAAEEKQLNPAESHGEDTKPYPTQASQEQPRLIPLRGQSSPSRRPHSVGQQGERPHHAAHPPHPRELHEAEASTPTKHCYRPSTGV